MTTPTNQIEKLHRDAIIVDGHCDILMAIAEGRMRLGDRFKVPDPATWVPPAGWQEPSEADMYNFTPHTSYFQTMGHYDLPRFRDGGLTAQAMAVYIDAKNLDRALEQALEMVYWLDREFTDNPDFVPITHVEEIIDSKRNGKIGGILTFEGFEPLGANLHFLDIFYRLGLRMATLTHSRRNYFADGTQVGVKTTGLTQPGMAAVKRMNELGIVIDLAHLAPMGCFEVLELSDAPVVLSHASPRKAFREDPAEHDSADAAKRLVEGIAQSGGLVGIIAYSQPDLSHFLDDIDAIVNFVGVDFVGLGTDFFGLEAAPTGFSAMDELPAVTAGLVERGYGPEDVKKILGENYLRVFSEVWK